MPLSPSDRDKLHRLEELRARREAERRLLESARERRHSIGRRYAPMAGDGGWWDAPFRGWRYSRREVVFVGVSVSLLMALVLWGLFYS